MGVITTNLPTCPSMGVPFPGVPTIIPHNYRHSPTYTSSLTPGWVFPYLGMVGGSNLNQNVLFNRFETESHFHLNCNPYTSKRELLNGSKYIRHHINILTNYDKVITLMSTQHAQEPLVTYIVGKYIDFL